MNDSTQRPRPRQFVLSPMDNLRLANFCGPFDENIRQIERGLDIQISRRHDHFTLTGDKSMIKKAEAAIQQFYQEASVPLGIDQIQLGLLSYLNPATDDKTPQPQPTEANATVTTTRSSVTLQTRKSDLHGRTPHQVDYIEAILNHDICFGIGPAGTGKTYLAVACAVDAFERELVERIILTRPAVEAGEHLGFLPGDLSQKVDPYLRPLYDALYALMGFERVSKCLERGTIEIAPLAFMRGRTLNHAFIILDEAQNTTPEQMKMFLTRIGIGAKAVITGDLTQIDLHRGQKSGLKEVEHILAEVRGIRFIYFDKFDVVRHPLVARIVAAYEQNDQKEREKRTKYQPNAVDPD